MIQQFSLLLNDKSVAMPCGGICLTAILGMAMSTVALAQVDPFAAVPDAAVAPLQTPDAAGNPAPATGASAATGAAATQENITDPLVRALREDPPKTPQDMALAIQWMTRISNWNEVGRLLQLAQSANWTTEQSAAMAREGGSALWIKLGGQPGLTAEQRAQVGEILSAPAKLARDPEWINRWIDALGSQSPSERRYAQLKLHDSSFAAIERLVARLLDVDSKVAPIMLLGTVMEFGSDGLDALRAASLVPEPARAVRALSAMAQWKGSEFNAELGAGLLSLALSPEQQSALSELVARHRGQLPSDTAIRDYLANKFQLQLNDYQTKRVEYRGLQDFVWRLGDNRQSVSRVAAPLEQRSLERLAQLAAHRILSRSATQRDLTESTVALLQRAYKVSPDLDANAAGLLIDLPLDVMRDIGLWVKVIELSQQWQMHGASMRAVQELGRGIEGDNGIVEQPLATLSELLKDSRPAMRYLAFEAIAKIDPQSAYWGAERQLETAIEMSRLGPGPLVLVIGLREGLRNAAEQQLKLSGANVLATNSFREALRYLEQPQPVEMIVIVDRMAEQSVTAAVDRLRQARRGSALPIAVLTDKLDEFESNRLAGVSGVVVSVLSRDAEQMPRVLSRLEALLDTRPLTSAERGRFASSASKFLGTIAADPERYRFYPLQQSAEALVTMQTELLPEAKLNLLAAAGTAASQEQLVRLTASGSLDKSRRLAAAQAFKRSIHRFGVRMNRSAVSGCYDLYNELGPTDQVAVEAIGLVLDAIEAGAGQKDWSQVKLASP